MTQDNKQIETDPFFGLPKWVNFIATDGNGYKIGYENKPTKSTNHKWWVDFKIGRIAHISQYDNPANGWENSLIERKK